MTHPLISTPLDDAWLTGPTAAAIILVAIIGVVWSAVAGGKE